MKKTILEFIRRGLIACGFGPLVLVVLYLILQSQCDMHTVSVNEACIGIVSLSVLSFIAGGINVIYQIERLPLTAAIFIHGFVLYVFYLGTYILNGWLADGATPILVFTGVFTVGYPAIWAIIYSITRRNTAKLNEKLKMKQENAKKTSST
ncbi:MAG: DUF3021 domain-containing protein [Ruminococcaceae bacterium]|nr:DUF3021 domain-containing protein [Oscillospiraceae bacterium]